MPAPATIIVCPNCGTKNRVYWVGGRSTSDAIKPLPTRARGGAGVGEETELRCG